MNPDADCCGRHNYCGRDCSRLQPPPKHPRLMRAVGIIFWLMCLFVLTTTPFAILYGYATWGGDCLERGGHIVGSAFETRCEGSK